MCKGETSTVPSLHTVGSRVWLADGGEDGWIKGEVVKIENDTQLTVLLEDGSEKVCDQADVPLQNPGMSGVEDMTTLSYLNEPGVLWNLKVRYQQDDIYTYTGSILIAINPFTPMPHLYGTHMMEQYKGTQLGEISPHVYAIADAAYSQMRSEGRSQSILVSGESGAGKTETSKLIMQYLAWVGGYLENDSYDDQNGNCRSVEQQVLESNPLLEAFGNAKTVRNDNSSRFGKFTEIQFNTNGRICGAAIRTYLLERSRVVNVNDPERNYHVFYQLCDGASDEERDKFKLLPASEFRYLNTSTCFNLDGTSNADDYTRTRRAMTLIGMPQEEQNTVFRLIAAVLHLGNIMFEEEGDDASHVSPGKPEMALKTAADLLAINAEDLQRVLTTRSRETPEGIIVSPIDAKAAEINRDSLAKTIYSRLFDWLVGRINASIGQDTEAKSLIGVLDIYGFEQFRSNDFEQFCINLANEKLQQHFNQHVFKMEQAEYEREKIEWSYIEFVDNQDVLDLIEGKMGILDLLDESCRFPRATHEDFAQKLYSSQYISKSHRFTKPRLAKSDFSLDHYAGGVTYRTENFLEKNKDFVVADHEALMLSSTIDLLRSLFQETDAATGGEARQGLSRSSFKFSSVASRFKKQLTDLMDTLHKMEPHYIRCIKPNGMNNPMSFENNNVLHQLRCGGVLEAVRISCAGYPSKPYYEEFNDHYWPLAPDSMNLDDRSLARKILESNLGSDGYQFGETRVFLRAGKMAELDKMRTEVLNTAAKTIQRCARAWMARLHFNNALRAIVAIQSGFRGHMARQLTQEIRYNKAATLIQSTFRRFYARRKFRQAVWAAIAVQKAWKIYCRHKIEMEAAKISSATIVQSYWRAHIARTDFTNFRKSVIMAQNVWRCKLARRELLKRRVESRESSKLLQDKQDLQNKLNEMQVLMKKLQDQRSELRQQLRDEKSAREEAERLASKATEEGRRLLDAEKENMESENNKLKSDLMNLKAEIAALSSQVKSKSDEASAAELKARENAESSNKRISELENVLKEVQNKAKRNAEDLMNRLNNAVSQRDEAREQAMMLNAKLEQLQKEISSRRFMDSPVSTASGHLIASGVSSSPSSARVAQSPHQENGKLSPIQRVPGSRTVDSSTAEGLSEMDRRQKELFAKQQQLLREQRSADQEKLLSILRQDLGFHQGKPVAAVLVFRCCLQWKSFQADRTPIFDRINATMGEQVEECNEQNDRLAYWLSNTVSLLYLMQTLIKPASAGSGYAARLRQSGQQARGLLGSASKSLSAYFGRSLPGSGHALEEASIHGGTAGEFRQVEAKYPALLFKQQLDAFVQRIFPMLRDNVKKEISPYLSACIHAPRSAHGSRTARRHASSNGGSVAEDTSDPWKHILSAFEGLLNTLKANHVPPFLVCKLFEQLFSFVNVQLFNQLLLRRECCSFSNGEYVKTGLSEVEIWAGKAGRDWLGDAWDNLAHIRQAVTFLVIHQKSKKNLNEITSDLCPVLSIQQLYRISTMYWDDRYGTETVSHEVLARMKQLMVEGTSSGAAGHSFLLDEDANIPFTQEDIAIALRGHDLISEIPLPETLRDVPSFSFLNKKPELSAHQNTG